MECIHLFRYLIQTVVLDWVRVSTSASRIPYFFYVRLEQCLSVDDRYKIVCSSNVKVLTTITALRPFG